MATVWVTLASEAVVLLAAAGAAVAWVRRTPANAPEWANAPEPARTSDQDLGQPASSLVEQPA